MVELEVIAFPTEVSNFTVRCKATAPTVDSHLYNAVLLNPSVITFFFNEHRIPVRDCQPSSKNREKMCELVISNLVKARTGKYHCMARNAIRCTTKAVNIPPPHAKGIVQLFQKSWTLKIILFIITLHSRTTNKKRRKHWEHALNTFVINPLVNIYQRTNKGGGLENLGNVLYSVERD